MLINNQIKLIYKIEFKHIIKMICSSISSYLLSSVGGIVGFVVPLIYGIFALTPSGPFETPDKTLGIVLIVLACTIFPTVGAILGFIVGLVIGSPIDCCCNNCED